MCFPKNYGNGQGSKPPYWPGGQFRNPPLVKNPGHGRKKQSKRILTLKDNLEASKKNLGELICPSPTALHKSYPKHTPPHGYILPLSLHPSLSKSRTSISFPYWVSKYWTGSLHQQSRRNLG